MRVMVSSNTIPSSIGIRKPSVNTSTNSKFPTIRFTIKALSASVVLPAPVRSGPERISVPADGGGKTTAKKNAASTRHLNNKRAMSNESTYYSDYLDQLESESIHIL